MTAEPADALSSGASVSLPADRSFVLQLRADAGLGPEGPWAGRVEHVVSGHAARFESCAALCEFIAQVLASTPGPAPRPGTKERPR